MRKSPSFVLTVKPFSDGDLNILNGPYQGDFAQVIVSTVLRFDSLRAAH